MDASLAGLVVMHGPDYGAESDDSVEFTDASLLPPPGVCWPHTDCTMVTGIGEGESCLSGNHIEQICDDVGTSHTLDLQSHSLGLMTMPVLDLSWYFVVYVQSL